MKSTTLAVAVAAVVLATQPALAQQTPAESSTPPASAQARISQILPPPEHIFGDWGGFRSALLSRGVTYTLDYTTETVGNIAGGRRTGADYAHQIGLAVDVDWEKLAGIPGFTTHGIVINRAGRNASADYVGDTVLQAQEIYGAGFGEAVKLVWLYGEEKLLDGRLAIAAGRFAPGADFNSSPLYCNFMTLTICGHDRALTANQGFEDWPMSEWGGRVKVRPTDTTYLQIGLFQSQPFPTDLEPYTQGGHSGWDWTLDGTTGVSVPVEAGYEPLVGPDQMPGHYKLGFNWDTSRYPDNFLGVDGLPIALTGMVGRPHDGRGQYWVNADQMVMRNGPNPNDGLILLATYVHDDSATTLFNDFVWAGVIDRGFWSVRPNDQIGFGVTYYDVSKGLTRTEELQRSLGVPLAGGARGVQTHAEVLELNYGIDVAPGILVQPELEYFIRPGGTGSVPNAFLIGLKTHADF